MENSLYTHFRVKNRNNKNVKLNQSMHTYNISLVYVTPMLYK